MAVYNEVKWVGVKPTVKVAQNGGTTVAVGAVSTDILAVNDDRTSFYIENIGTDIIYVFLGSPATVNHLSLAPGDTIVCDDYTGVVTGIVSAGTQDVYIVEL